MGKLKTLTGYATFIGLIAMWLLLFYRAYSHVVAIVCLQR